MLFVLVAAVSRQCSNERKRRYSDSAHITVDSPNDYSPLLRSKSLDDLHKKQLLAETDSSAGKFIYKMAADWLKQIRLLVRL